MMRGATPATAMMTAVVLMATPAVGQTTAGIAPRLAEAGARAMAVNPGVLSARSALRAAGHELRAARWMQYPSVSVGARTGDQLGELTTELTVFQPLWDGGRIAGSLDRARAQQAAAQAAVAETELDVLIRLSMAYYDAMRARRVTAVLTDGVSEHRQLVESMQRRVDQEISPRTDLDLAQGRLAQVEQELAAMQAQARAAERRLATLVGETTFDLGETPTYQPASHHPVDQAAVDAALRCHPRIARLSAEAAIAQADQRTRRAETWPTLGAQYSHDRISGHQVGLALRMQTAGGLAPLSSLEAATARLQGIEQQTALARQQVEEAVTLDLVENLSARARITASGASAIATDSVMESYLRQFAAGRRTWLDLMNAVRERNAARITLIEVETSAMSSSARLLLNSCAWRPDGPDGAAA